MVQDFNFKTLLCPAKFNRYIFPWIVLWNPFPYSLSIPLSFPPFISLSLSFSLSQYLSLSLPAWSFYRWMYVFLLELNQAFVWWLHWTPSMCLVHFVNLPVKATLKLCNSMIGRVALLHNSVLSVMQVIKRPTPSSSCTRKWKSRQQNEREQDVSSSVSWIFYMAATHFSAMWMR